MNELCAVKSGAVGTDGFGERRISSPRSGALIRHTEGLRYVRVTGTSSPSIQPVMGLKNVSSDQDTTTSGADAVFRCSLLTLVLTTATQTVIAIFDAVTWAWWAAAACLGVAVVLAGRQGERAGRRGRARQVLLVIDEEEFAALVRRDL